MLPRPPEVKVWHNLLRGWGLFGRFPRLPRGRVNHWALGRNLLEIEGAWFCRPCGIWLDCVTGLPSTKRRVAAKDAMSEPPYVGCYEGDWERSWRGFERRRLFFVAAAGPAARDTAALRGWESRNGRNTIILGTDPYATYKMGDRRETKGRMPEVLPPLPGLGCPNAQTHG